ncbi:MAG: hypothetical protein SNJ64_03285 [Endomicrobiia bacterium]
MTIEQWQALGLKPPVLAGLDAEVYQDGKKVGWATGLRFSDDFELQGIRVLGHHGDIGFKSMGFTGQMTVGTLVLESGFADNLETPNRDIIINQKPRVFRVLDIATKKVLFTIVGAACGGRDISFQEGQLVAKDTTWRYTNSIDGEVS